jgi:hypothetical protein
MQKRKLDKSGLRIRIGFRSPKLKRERRANRLLTFPRALSPTLKYFSHCAAIALCRARKTYF